MSTILGVIPKPQFVGVRFDLLDSQVFDAMDGPAIKLYLKLRRFIWRSEDGPIGDYFARGLLVVDGYLRQWGTWLGVSKSTVSRILAQLEEAGWIEWARKSQRGGETNVLVLGRWVEVGGDRVEVYFVDTVASMQQTVANLQHTVAPVQPSNRERIENNNIVSSGELEGAALLDAFGLGQSITAEIESAGDNIADPVMAGGADSPAEIVVDGICRYNKFRGIDDLPEKQRASWVNHLAEIIKQWGGATEEQAKLAWEAWTVEFAWKSRANPFQRTFTTDFGPLVVAVRNGGITKESLLARAKEEGLIDDDGPREAEERMHQDPQYQVFAELRRQREAAKAQ